MLGTLDGEGDNEEFLMCLTVDRQVRKRKGNSVVIKFFRASVGNEDSNKKKELQ